LDDFYAPDIGLARSVEHANAEARTPEVVRTLSAYSVGNRRSESKAPSISSREPAPDTPVQFNDHFISVSFDEPMDRLGPTPQFRLTKANGEVVPVLMYWGNDRILTGFIPGMLTTGPHRLQLQGELEDLAANAASGSRECTVLIDREGPSVVTSSPAAGATGVSTSAPITVTLNEAADLPVCRPKRAAAACVTLATTTP
jgi:Bacterial Ig-like domain